MKNIIERIKTRFNNHSIEEKYILMIAASLLMPYPITAVAVVVWLVHIIKEGYYKSLFKEFKNSKYLVYFSIFILATSIVHLNYLGILISIGLFFVCVFVLYYRKFITKDCFEFIIDIVIVLGALNLLYCFFEYYLICQRLDLNYFDFIVKNRPENRIHSGFFNANYFAMMLEFILICIIYRFVRSSNKIRCMLVVNVAVLFFILYLSGCRTAWPAVMAIIGLSIFILGNNKLRLFIIIAVLAVVAIVVVKPDIIPRMDNIAKYLGVRGKIWGASIEAIKDNPLFGQGPMTYMQIYSAYKGHPTQHAHSVYIDPLLSFGVVGLALIAPYIYESSKQLYKFFRSKKDNLMLSTALCTIIAILVHGVLDYTVFWLQTGILALILIYCVDAYKGEKNV